MELKKFLDEYDSKSSQIVIFDINLCIKSIIFW